MLNCFDGLHVGVTVVRMFDCCFSCFVILFATCCLFVLLVFVGLICICIEVNVYNSMVSFLI